MHESAANFDTSNPFKIKTKTKQLELSVVKKLIMMNITVTE